MDTINNGLTYVFGENAALDGEANGEWILDTFYYKDTPLWDAIFKMLRDAFWNALRPIIELFNQ